MRLETEGEVLADQPTDSRGQFRFINLPIQVNRNLANQVYRLTVTAEGYQTQTQWLDERHGVQGRYLPFPTRVIPS